MMYYEQGCVIHISTEEESEYRTSFSEALQYAISEKEEDIRVITNDDVTASEILTEIHSVKSEDIISYFVDEIQEHLEYEDIDTDSVYEYVDQVFRDEFCWKIANKIRENME